MEEGVDGLLRDKTWPLGRKPLSPERVAAIVHLTQTPRAGEETHWTLWAMAKATGVAAATARTISQARGLTPLGFCHRTWKPDQDNGRMGKCRSWTNH